MKVPMTTAAFLPYDTDSAEYQDIIKCVIVDHWTNRNNVASQDALRLIITIEKRLGRILTAVPAGESIIDTGWILGQNDEQMIEAHARNCLLFMPKDDKAMRVIRLVETLKKVITLGGPHAHS